MVVPAAPYTRRTRHAEQALHKAEPGDYNHCRMNLSKEVANVGVTAHVQQRLNGSHGTPVHAFLW